MQACTVDTSRSHMNRKFKEWLIIHLLYSKYKILVQLWYMMVGTLTIKAYSTLDIVKKGELCNLFLLPA